MVFCIRKLNWMKAAPETKIFRNYAKYDPAKFCEDLSMLRGVNWVEGMNSSGTVKENVISGVISGSILSPHSLMWLVVTPRLSRSEYVV